MRRNYKQIATSGSISADFTSDVWSVEDADTYAIQIVFSGSSPNGTFALQTSVDGGTTWTTIISQAVTANGDIVWENGLCAVPQIRIKYTRTSGTGTVNIYGFKKGTID